MMFVYLYCDMSVIASDFVVNDANIGVTMQWSVKAAVTFWQVR
jgi:hypothetical protein